VILLEHLLEFGWPGGRIRVAGEEKRQDIGDLQRAAEPVAAVPELASAFGPNITPLRTDRNVVTGKRNAVYRASGSSSILSEK
jgi:hypothetical protein